MATPNKIIGLHLFSTFLVASLGGVRGEHYSSNIRCFERERQALLKFKDELVDEHGRLSSWGVGKNRRECCKWRGVRCHNPTNHVIQLNLGGFYYTPLQGKISPYLVELKHLTHLDLSYNDFGYSNFPEFIGSFEKLQQIDPPSVGNLSELIYLDLSWNFALYSENLDWVSHLGSLKYLDLSYIGLDNASNWLQAISKLTSIKELHFAWSELQDIHPTSLPVINSSAPLAILDLQGNPEISSRTFQWFLNFSKSLTFIDLSDNNITTGLISAYTFDNQIFLAHLDLSFNYLECGIPKSIGNMSSLIYLNLEGNHLTAQLSELMMNLSGPLEKKLQYLDLSDNMISGSLPDFSRFSFMNHLDLGWNELNDSIANGFLNIPHLIHLDLSSNEFTGTIPDLTFSPFLKRLYLNNNMFNGHLRESIGCLSKLEVLLLSSNRLEGMITEVHLFNLSQLKELDLSYNSLLTVNCSPRWIPPFQLTRLNLSHCKIGPSFPQWLQFQINLEFLDISSSQIAEAIPSWFGNLASTLIYLNASNNQIYGVLLDNTGNSFFRSNGEALDLSRNNITGEANFLCYFVEWESIDLSNNLFFGLLPNCFTNFALLRSLNLANNYFFGDIPDSSYSYRLLAFNLSRNNLSGPIPQNIGFLVNLESLDLSRNYLDGDIPISLLELRFVKVLDLSYNNLCGRIPLQIPKFDESTYTGNSGLCGYPKRKSCPEDDDDTMKEHEDDKLITKGFYICMGVGFFLGLWWVCIFQIVGLWSIRRRTQN